MVLPSAGPALSATGFYAVAYTPKRLEKSSSPPERRKKFSCGPKLARAAPRANIKTSLTPVRQNRLRNQFDSHEDPMLDPESDVAEQLANALRHHQKNLLEKDRAEKDVERLREMMTQLEAMTNETGRND